MNDHPLNDHKLNDPPRSSAETDEEYFREGLYQQDSNTAHSTHADALHADALHADMLGREITPRDTARTELAQADTADAYPADTAYEEIKPTAADALGASSDSAVGQDGQLTDSTLEAETLYGSYQSIDSTYFNITNRHDSPVAGLTVLMDTTGQAIRSELHLYEDSSDAEQQEAIRQANVLIKNQFSSHYSDPDSQMLELRIFNTKQKYATLYVDLPERAQVAQRKGWNVQRLWPLAAALLLIPIGLFLGWWLISNLMSGSGFGLTGDATQSEGAAVVESADAETQGTLNLDPNQPILNLNEAQGEIVQGEVAQGEVVQGQVVQGQPVTDGSAQSSGNGAGTSVVQGSVQAGSSQATTGQTTTGQTSAAQNPAAPLEWVNPSEINENGLPTSTNANAAINRSSRVRVLDGLEIRVRSHPGPAVGTEKGIIQGGDEAIVVGGPYWTEGDWDTIVWWYLRFDDNTEGWVAANTSKLTLLEPIQ